MSIEDPFDRADRTARGRGRSIATELAACTHTSLPAVQSRLGEAWVLSTELAATLTALVAPGEDAAAGSVPPPREAGA